MNKPFKPLLLIAAVAALVVVLFASSASGGSSSNANASKGATVSVRDNFFSPKSRTVARGTKVTWRWRGSSDHNVKFRKVPSGASKRGSSTQSSGRFSRSLTKKGTYKYVCTIHLSSDGMRGTITVR
jgi:plastocyanin